MKFTYSNPTTIYFGQGRISAIANAIPTNQKVLVIYGGGSIKANGIYDQVAKALAQHEWLEFSGVEPNPSIETLDEAVKVVKAQNIDFILAVGGGSVIDGSKYVAAAACYEGDGWDILTGKHQVNDATPIGAVLTIPATGSESNGGSVITRKSTHEKLYFVSDKVFPKFAVLDPDVIKTLPERQVANGIVDAFVHVCEQYLTYPTRAWVQDGYAEVLLRNLVNLATQFKERDSDLWRANFMWTANQALNGLIGAGVPQDWATHMIGHEITAHYGLDHARSLAVTLPSLLRHQLESKKVKLAQMGRSVFGLVPGIELAERTIKEIENMFRGIDVGVRLSEVGINDENLPDIIADSLDKHGMTQLGENGAITPNSCKEILVKAK